MNKKQKIWIFVLVFFLLLDIIIHFTLGENTSTFSVHVNYVASIFMAFTVGLSVADDTSAFRG